MTGATIWDENGVLPAAPFNCVIWNVEDAYSGTPEITDIKHSTGEPSGRAWCTNALGLMKSRMGPYIRNVDMLLAVEKDIFA